MFGFIKSAVKGVFKAAKAVVETVGGVAMSGVKYLSGDSEREKWVKKLEEYFDTIYRPTITNKVNEVNQEIPPLNERINYINSLRYYEIRPKITSLSGFLGQFGNVKPIAAYTNESNFTSLQVPEQHFEEVSDYIEDNDLSTSEIIERIVFNLFSIRSKNREACIAIQEKINELKLNLEHLLGLLEAKKRTYIQNRIIADMYIQTIQMILKFIEEVILPEINTVESFLQANRLKDEILSGNRLAETNIVFDNRIKVLANTPYHRHYMFVKNAFMFYVIACKIYSSPILTRLLQGNSTCDEQYYKNDVAKLNQQIGALNEQKQQVMGFLTWGGIEKNAA